MSDTFWRSMFIGFACFVAGFVMAIELSVMNYDDAITKGSISIKGVTFHVERQTPPGTTP